ncbi:MAG TPA: glycosyltransferase family A protein [Vicinamibacterales bacterium]|nr:glycosyltransferase family A protein [Vicinamibacterales bacterium]
MTSAPCTFTVFTPTYNRAHTLHRVYESLSRQTFRDFEWLIVDDGSNDNTGDLAARWRTAADFPIRYVRQPNRGKHVAFNHGVREATGRLFLPLDSDDACVPQALERFIHHWESIPEEEKARFTGVTALCMDETGQPIDRAFPLDVTDSDSLEMRYRFHITGEKWGFHRTDVLRSFPFPEDVPRGYLPEAVVWSRIARIYKTRFVNEALRIYQTDQPSLMRGNGPERDAASARLADLMVLNEHLDYFKYAPLAFCRSAAQYVRLSTHARIGPCEQFAEIGNPLGKALWMTAYPVGLAVYLRDRRTARRQARLNNHGNGNPVTVSSRS